MNIEKFEEILRWKYDNGTTGFTGNLSGNRYRITNPSKSCKGYNLFINGAAVKSCTNFFSIACEIYDRELEVAKG